MSLSGSLARTFFSSSSAASKFFRSTSPYTWDHRVDTRRRQHGREDRQPDVSPGRLARTRKAVRPPAGRLDGGGLQADGTDLHQHLSRIPRLDRPRRLQLVASHRGTTAGRRGAPP